MEFLNIINLNAGSGSGSGSGDGIESVNGKHIHRIDGIPTIIDSIRGDVAKGRIFRPDFTFSLCFIVKRNGFFAHGETLRDAMDALDKKLFQDMSEDDRIDAFLAAHPDLNSIYPNADFFLWHNKLTGSCETGRKAFAEDYGIDIKTGSMTVVDFIDLTKDAYGGHIIKALEARLDGMKNV